MRRVEANQICWPIAVDIVERLAKIQDDGRFKIDLTFAIYVDFKVIIDRNYVAFFKRRGDMEYDIAYEALSRPIQYAISNKPRKVRIITKE